MRRKSLASEKSKGGGHDRGSGDRFSADVSLAIVIVGDFVCYLFK